MTEEDMINHPRHYTELPFASEVSLECLDVTRHMDFCGGNALKYIWRSGRKGDGAEEDLKKAKFYLNECANRPAQDYRTALAVFSLIGSDYSDRYAAIWYLLNGDFPAALRKVQCMLFDCGSKGVRNG